MFKEDIDLINKFHEERGHSEGSKKTYKHSIKLFTEYHNTSLTHLINEALEEQEKEVPTHKLKVYDRLMNFRTQYLIPTRVGNSVGGIERKIKTIYKHNRIHLPYLPPINRKQIKNNPEISFEDLLTKEEIINGLKYLSKSIKSRILDMVTGGFAIEETQQKTVGMFLKGNYTDHYSDDIQDALEILSKKDNVVTCFNLKRKKTGVSYYGFCNPETTQLIVEDLLQRNIKSEGESLFRHYKTYVNTITKEVNDKLNLGTAGGYSRFSPHMFRRYNATFLNQGQSLEENINLSKNEIDALQGRAEGATREAYFKSNPIFLKLAYVKAMNNVSLYKQYSYEIVEGKIVIHCIDPKKENKVLKKKVREGEEFVENLKGDEGLNNYVNLIGEDEFKQRLIEYVS